MIIRKAQRSDAPSIAPILLLTARLLQGLSVGGEYGVSATYLSEMASKNRRGFYSSFQYVTLIGGQLLALGIQLILQKILLKNIKYGMIRLTSFMIQKTH